MTNREEFLSLYEKFLRGECNAFEKEQLESYQDDMKLQDSGWEDQELDQQVIYQRIWDKLKKSRNIYPFVKSSYPGADEEELLSTDTYLSSNKISRRISIFSWLKAAGILLLAGSAIWWFSKSAKPVIPATAVITANKPADIQPGSNKAYLTLADGSKIVLNDAKNGSLTTQSGIQITKTKDGMIVYQFKDNPGTGLNREINTITTPRGGQYQLILSDGTKVWMNAASLLKFPAKFTGKERRVELSGEAYFEVHRNSARPFIVQLANQEVQVLGTHFNIKAYQDEQVKTSLLEGKVNVLAAGKTALLLPGQEAVRNKDGVIKVSYADVEESIAWKNGFFQFNNSGIEETMRQIARWYNIKVSYEGHLPAKQFTGKISRKASITEILDMLSYSGIKFKIEGDQIIVLPE